MTDSTRELPPIFRWETREGADGNEERTGRVVLRDLGSLTPDEAWAIHGELVGAAQDEGRTVASPPCGDASLWDLKAPAHVLTSGRRTGRTSAAMAWLRESSDHAMLARDNPATAELVAREGLAVETIMRDGKPTGDLLLRAMSPKAWEDDAGLVRRAVASRSGAPGRHPRWSHVSKIFGLGSGYSSKLCRRLGFDPDEVVGQVEDEQVEDDVDQEEGPC